MPNWTSNILTVSGDEKLLQEFREKARVISDDNPEKKIDFCFESFLPMPAELNGIMTGSTTINGTQYSQWREMNNLSVPLEEEELKRLKKKYGATNWYDRNCNVLGTKWDVTGSLVVVTDAELRYTFDSAWCPPVQGLVAISKMYPGLKFHIEFEQEEGGGGTYTIEKGDIVDESSYEASEEDED